MKKLSLYLGLMIITTCLSAQNATVSEIDDVNFNHVSSIRNGDDVTAYYALVSSKKKNKGQETWSLNIFDRSLGIIKSVDILKPKETIAIQTVDNGTHLCILFANRSDKIIECAIYDLKGNLTGTYKPVLSELETKNLKTLGGGMDPAGSVMGIPGKGFIRQGWSSGEGFRAALFAFDNQGKDLWKWEHGTKTEKPTETIQMNYLCGNNLFVYLNYTEKKASGFFLDVVDLNTGQLKNSIDRKKGDQIQSPFGVKYDNDKKDYLVYGMTSINNEPSDYYIKGIYFQRLDENGKVKEEKTIDWETEVKKLIPEKSTHNTITGAGFYFLDANIMPDGRIKIIGERYARRMNVGVGVSIGGGGSGGGPSATLSMDVARLFIFSFSPDMKLENIEEAEKKQHDAQSILKQGSAGDIIAAIETPKLVVFDYLFMTGANEAPRMVYMDVDKIKNKEATYVIRSQVIEKKGTSSKKEIAMNSETGFFEILQGDKGKVVLAEYFSKTNELKLSEVKAY